MGEGWVEMGNDDSSRRKGMFKGSVERAGTTMAVTYLTYLRDFFFYLPVDLVLQKLGVFSPHIAVGFPTGCRLQSQ